MNFNDRTVLVRRGKNWWYGQIVDGKFLSQGKCEGPLSFSKEEQRYMISIYRHAQIQGLDLTKKEIDDVRKGIGYTEIIVIDEMPPEPTGKIRNITEKAWRDYWMKYTHIRCQTCAKKCKQSSRVHLFCSHYKEKKR